MGDAEEYNSYFFTFIIFIVMIFLLAVLRVVGSIGYYRANWNDYRCKSYIIPFASFVNKKVNNTDNFNYCMARDAANLTRAYSRAQHKAAAMVDHELDVLNKEIRMIEQDVINEEKKLSELFTYLSNYFTSLLAPFTGIFTKFKSVTQKAHVALGVLGYSMYTQIFTARSFLGATADIMVKFLRDLKIAMASASVVGGIEVAATMMLLYELVLRNFEKIAKGLDKLNIKHKKKPKKGKLRGHRHCFSHDTRIGKDNKTIIDLNLSDRLNPLSEKTSNHVSFLMKCLKTDDMYLLDDVRVSAFHKVLYNGQYIAVKDHPKATRIHYDSNFVYCLGTSKKYFKINNTTYLDWDDVETKDSPGYTTGGFSYDTKIKMNTGLYKNIMNIRTGDILFGNNQVSGVVIVEEKPLFEHTYDDIRGFKASYCVYAKESPVLFRNNTDERGIVYHLLTDNHTFIVNNNIVVHDFDYEP